MRRIMTRLSVVLVLLVGSCSVIPSPLDSGGPKAVGTRIETVLADAEFPVAIAFAHDGRALYTEKNTGRIRILSAAGELLSEPFASVPVVTNSERGLLGITLHPEFEGNGFVYVYYTRSNTGQTSSNSSAAQDNRVVRFTAAGNVAAGGETLIARLPVLPGPNHDGGNIRFGPDGKLYVTIGDLAQSDNAQDIDALAGRMLRYNDDGTIPAANPFGPDNPTFALGLRNSFDFAFDPVGGALFASENGPDRHDEINRIIAGSNYGWPSVQGFADDAVGDPEGESSFVPEFGTYVDPLIDETDGVVAPTGVDFAPDATLGADSESRLFVGQFNTGRVVRYTLNESRDGLTDVTIFAQGIEAGITDVAFAPDGTLYVLTSTSILRIVPDN